MHHGTVAFDDYDDDVSELVDMSITNLNADGLGPALESGEIEMVAGDGREGTSSNSAVVPSISTLSNLFYISLGWPKGGTYHPNPLLHLPSSNVYEKRTKKIRSLRVWGVKERRGIVAITGICVFGFICFCIVGFGFMRF